MEIKQVSSEHGNELSEKPYPTQEVKRRHGTGVGSPSGTGVREKEWGQRVKT